MKITSLFIMIFVSTVNLNCAMGEESESSAIWNKISAFFSRIKLKSWGKR